MANIRFVPRRGGVVSIPRGRGRPSKTPALLNARSRLKKSSAPKFKRSSMLTFMNRKKTIVKPTNIRPTPGVTSHSLFKAYKSPNAQVKAMKRVGAPNLTEVNFGSQSIAKEGFQNAYITSWLNQTDVQNIFTKVPSTSTVQPGYYKTTRCVVGSLQGEVMMTNSSLASCYVEIYDIARKRDANKTEFVWTQDPLTAWIRGIQDSTGLGQTDFQFLKASPFDSQVFKDWFKVVKRTRIELSQGATHKHGVLLNPNKLVDASMPNFVDGDYAGLTMYTMVVFYGQPASVPQENAPAIVTTAQVALDFVTNNRIKYHWVSDTTFNVYQQDNLSSIAGEQVVSIGAGDIKPNAIV